MATVDRIAGTLLGTALGDALGLAAEGMSALTAIARRFGRVERFHLIGSSGFVSDDTEQSCSVAQSLARHPDDLDRCVGAFRRSLLGWFCRLPWGVAGLATVRASLRIGLGFSRSGVFSAGNGAAMRAAIIGTFFDNRPVEAERFSGPALAEATHLDPRAIEARPLRRGTGRGLGPGARSERSRRCASSKHGGRVTVASLAAVIDRGSQPRYAAAPAPRMPRSRAELPGLCCTAFRWQLSDSAGRRRPTPRFDRGRNRRRRHRLDRGNPGRLAWSVSRRGRFRRVPIDKIHDGPFGPTHLSTLAHCLAGIRDGRSAAVPR